MMVLCCVLWVNEWFKQFYPVHDRYICLRGHVHHATDIGGGNHSRAVGLQGSQLVRTQGG
jgi:hypothetical protein